jgi:glucose/arabinose dehydrogenase
MRSTVIALLAALAAFLMSASAAGALTLPAGFEAERIADGLDLPTAVAWAPDGRVFVAEKSGTVRVISAAGRLEDDPLIDISGHVNDAGDRGLIGIAVDAGFAVNGYLYLLYVNDPAGTDSGGPTSSRLTRIVVNPDDSVAGPLAPETVILGRAGAGPCPPAGATVDCIADDSDSHAIGTVRADADGTLWVGSGDGADYGRADPLAVRTYDPNSLNGKILHVDRDGRGVDGHPLCPGRPLDENCTKVYASGFRNPFRFVLRPGATPVVGDVGWFNHEEINVLRPGGDYGWPCYEGPSRTVGYRDLDECAPAYAREGTPAASLGPSWSYPHAEGDGYAVVAGPVYDGTSYPDGFRGTMFVADYARGWVKRLTLAGEAVTDETDFADEIGAVDLEADPDGNLAIVSMGDFTPGAGYIDRIVYSPGNAAPVVSVDATPRNGRAPLDVSFSTAGTFDPDGDPLTYAWDFDDGSPGSSSPDPLHTYARGGTFDARVRVSDGRGRSATKTVRVTVDGPRASIDGPADDSTYRDGQVVQLDGDAVDADGDPLPDAALRWSVVLVHNDHTHPGTTLLGRSPSFVATTDHDSDSYYRVTLTATDDLGAVAMQSITLTPEKGRFDMLSEPPGAPLSYAGIDFTAPTIRTPAIGFRTTVGAAPTFARDGKVYEWTGWSDGGARVHEVTVGEDAVDLVATYRETGEVVGPGPRGPPAPPGGPAPPRDTSSKVSVAWPRTGTPVSSLRGTATDPDGVRSVQVAVVQTEKKGCRWWSTKRGRLAAKPASCAFPHWITAKLGKRDTWSASLGARLPKSKYTVLVRVRDLRGSVTDVKYRSRGLGR